MTLMMRRHIFKYRPHGGGRGRSAPEGVYELIATCHSLMKMLTEIEDPHQTKGNRSPKLFALEGVYELIATCHSLKEMLTEIEELHQMKGNWSPKVPVIVKGQVVPVTVV